MMLKFCIIIESNSQKTFFSIVLYTNMAAVTSCENRQLGALEKATATATATRASDNFAYFFNEQTQCFQHVLQDPHVRFSFWYISSPSTVKERRNITKCEVRWRTSPHDAQILFFQGSNFVILSCQFNF